MSFNLVATVTIGSDFEAQETITFLMNYTPI